MTNVVKGFYVAAILLVLTSGFFARNSNFFDRFLFDVFALSVANTQTSNAVLIKINEESVAEYGGWPWPRSVHAALVNKLSAASVLVYDIVFAGQSADQAADQQLSQVIAANRQVVLPVLAQRDGHSGQLDTLFPFGDLKTNAFLGHIDMPLDEDQRFRSVYLKAGNANAQYPILGLAGLMMLSDELPALQGVRPTHERRERTGIWTRDYANLLVPRLDPDSVTMFTASDVLNGRVDQAVFKGRPVFVGICADDLAKKPMLAGFKERYFSDAEIQIEIFNALKNEQLITQQNTLFSLAYNCLAVLLALCLLYHTNGYWQRVFGAALLAFWLFVMPVLLARTFDVWLLQGHGALAVLITLLAYFLGKLPYFQANDLPVIHEGVWQSNLQQSAKQASDEHLAVAVIDIDHFDRYQLDKDRQTVVKTYYAIKQLVQKQLNKHVLLIEPYEQTKLIVLLQADEPKVMQTALEALPNAVQALGIAHHSSTAGKYISISMGASLTKRLDSNVLYVAGNADAALRQAIALGRNQAVLLN